MPPALAKAAYTCLLFLQTESWRREKLHSLIIYFKRMAKQLELPILLSQTPIQPILRKDTE